MVQLSAERDDALAEAAEAKAVADDAISTHHTMKAEIKVECLDPQTLICAPRGL